MPNRWDEVLAYAHTHPTRDGGTWNQWCESFIYRSGGFTQSYPSAKDAQAASTIVSRDVGAAPAGAIHWWDIGADGHVAWSMGDSRALMASGRVTDGWGVAIGTILTADYTRASGALYKGWSYDHGGQRLSGISTAGSTATTPIGELSMADAQQILDTLIGYGRRVEQIQGTLGAIQATLATIADRQTGYGRREEIIQEKLLPGLLAAVQAIPASAAPAPSGGPSVTAEEITAAVKAALEKVSLHVGE